MGGDVVDWYEMWRLLTFEFALTPGRASPAPRDGERLLGLKEESDYEGKPAGVFVGGKGERDC